MLLTATADIVIITMGKCCLAPINSVIINLVNNSYFNLFPTTTFLVEVIVLITREGGVFISFVISSNITISIKTVIYTAIVILSQF